MRSSTVPLLSFLLLLLLLLCVVVEVHSQTIPHVRFGNDGPALSNHSYLDLTTVGNNYDGSDSVQCVTDLATCCHSSQGTDRGDWYFPNGTKLPFLATSSYNIIIVERRGDMRVELHRGNNGVANGIYQCTIETDAVNNMNHNDDREFVYVGLYASGGEVYMCSVYYVMVIFF